MGQGLTCPDGSVSYRFGYAEICNNAVPPLVGAAYSQIYEQTFTPQAFLTNAVGVTSPQQCAQVCYCYPTSNNVGCRAAIYDPRTQRCRLFSDQANYIGPLKPKAGVGAVIIVGYGFLTGISSDPSNPGCPGAAALPPTTDGSCGLRGSFGGGPAGPYQTCQNTGFGRCCSKYNFCGNTPFACGTGCDFTSGGCDMIASLTSQQIKAQALAIGAMASSGSSSVSSSATADGIQAQVSSSSSISSATLPASQVVASSATQAIISASGTSVRPVLSALSSLSSATPSTLPSTSLSCDAASCPANAGQTCSTFLGSAYLVLCPGINSKRSLHSTEHLVKRQFSGSGASFGLCVRSCDAVNGCQSVAFDPSTGACATFPCAAAPPRGALGALRIRYANGTPSPSTVCPASIVPATGTPIANNNPTNGTSPAGVNLNANININIKSRVKVAIIDYRGMAVHVITADGSDAELGDDPDAAILSSSVRVAPSVLAQFGIGSTV